MQIHVALGEKSLWREFDIQCNEMIITKIGRNLFPILEYAFKGLLDHAEYQIGITMQPMGGQKLKFTAGRWDTVDVMEEILVPNEVLMQKSKNGRELMQRGLKLDKLKLTNAKDTVMKNDQMIRVQSMRQYLPILNIYEIHPTGGLVLVGKFQFPETKFIAVTAYQSDQVKHLKVQRNKFAQGFREGIRSQPSKRPASTSPNSTIDSSASPESSEHSLKTKKTKEECVIPYQEAPSNTHQLQYPFHFDPSWSNYWNSGFQNFQVQQPQQTYDFTMGQQLQYDYSNSFGYQWNCTN